MAFPRRADGVRNLFSDAGLCGPAAGERAVRYVGAALHRALFRVLLAHARLLENRGLEASAREPGTGITPLDRRPKKQISISPLGAYSRWKGLSGPRPGTAPRKE